MVGAALLLGLDMTRRARQSADYWDPAWAAEDLGFPDDPALVAAYALSEWVIAVVGPLFWIFLAAGFLAAELGSPCC